MVVANSLAYYVTAIFMTVKRFMVLAPGANVVKNYCHNLRIPAIS
jgi:hypothetical protein